MYPIWCGTSSKLLFSLRHQSILSASLPHLCPLPPSYEFTALILFLLFYMSNEILLQWSNSSAHIVMQVLSLIQLVILRSLSEILSIFLYLVHRVSWISALSYRTGPCISIICDNSKDILVPVSFPSLSCFMASIQSLFS